VKEGKYKICGKEDEMQVGKQKFTDGVKGQG
jgi:hypothetical protein